MKILVIDDDSLVRRTVSKILRFGGHEVVAAEDGVRGIALLLSELPDVVVTDMIMPEQQGVETIVKIRREMPTVKIIAISGGGRLGDVDVLTMAASLGADEVISKPFRADELLHLVNRPRYQPVVEA